MADSKIPQPKIILEGTHLTRKTDIAFELAEHPRIIGHRKHRWHIPLVSSEWETLSTGHPTKKHPGRSMITFEPHEESWAMEAFDIWARVFELHRDYYWIVDRFHISAISNHVSVFDRRLDFRWLESRLKDLNFLLVHCVRKPDTFVSAREDRLAYSENPERYENLDVFIQEQEQMKEIISLSQLKTMTLDVSDDDVAGATSRVLDWVEEIGGFWRV